MPSEKSSITQAFVFPSEISSPHEGAALVLNHTDLTLCPVKMQEAISERLRAFSTGEGLASNIHRANCIVPIRLAKILNDKPKLVAPAVRAFYLRDPLDLKVS